MSMISYFQSEERKLALVQEAATWIGTPFFPHGKVKGAGVDCVQLAAQIYIATGFLDAFEPGNYTMDGGRHAGSSIVLDWIEWSGNFEQVEPAFDGCKVGDLICFRVGKSKVAWHVGVMISEFDFIHVLQGREVVTGDLKNLQALRVVAVYRPMEVRS